MYNNQITTVFRLGPITPSSDNKGRQTKSANDKPKLVGMAKAQVVR